MLITLPVQFLEEMDVKIILLISLSFLTCDLEEVRLQPVLSILKLDDVFKLFEEIETDITEYIKTLTSPPKLDLNNFVSSDRVFAKLSK